MNSDDASLLSATPSNYSLLSNDANSTSNHLVRSCEHLCSEASDEGNDQEFQGEEIIIPKTRSVSASRLDCSVHYNDTPRRHSPPTHSLQSSARVALVDRLCGPHSNAPPLPGSRHPRKFIFKRNRQNFSRIDSTGVSDSCLGVNGSTKLKTFDQSLIIPWSTSSLHDLLTKTDSGTSLQSADEDLIQSVGFI